MPQLLRRGHVFIAQPPLYQIKRKKREEYVDDDLQLNRILISLGAEEVKLVGMNDGKEFSAVQLKEILELLERLQKYNEAIRRLGGNFADYLQTFHSKRMLPNYLVVIRAGNQEQVEYFHDETALRDFSSTNPDLNLFEISILGNELEGSELVEGSEGELPNVELEKTITRDKKSAVRKRRARLLEIHESKGIERLIVELAAKGMNIEQYAQSATPLFKMIDGETTHDIFSIGNILEMVKEVGRRGVQIKRFKGLGEMNAKELYETTMKPERRRFLKVELNDDNSLEAGKMFNLLMGEVVEPRRHFIEDNALNVRNLDV
jgi:DNA gyrase subunit B